MGAPTGNMSLCRQEIMSLCHQEIRDYNSNWNAVDEATMRADAWSSDKKHELLPHRQGEEAEAERMVRKRKQWGRKRYVETWDQFLHIVPKASLATTESHRPSRAHISPYVAPCMMTRTRARELIVKLHWGTIPKWLAKSKWTWTRPCLDWHMKAQGVFGMFGMILTIGFSKMVIKWSMTAANANGIFTELVAVGANWNAAQGVSACNIQKGREDTMTFVYLRALADHLGSDALPDTVFFFRRASPMMRAAEQQAGRVLLVCDTVNMLFSPCFRILQYYSWLRQVRYLAWL